VSADRDAALCVPVINSVALARVAESIERYFEERGRESGRRKVPVAVAKAALLDYYAGLSQRDVAEKYGVAESWASVTARQCGLPPLNRPKAKGRHVKRAESWRVEARRLWESGLSSGEIAVRIGKSPDLIGQVGVEMGWKRPPRACSGCGVRVDRVNGPRTRFVHVWCESCAAAGKRDAKRRESPKYWQKKAERQRLARAKERESKVAAGWVPIQEKQKAEAAARREARREVRRASNPKTQLAHYMRNGEAPSTQAGALRILQATLTKLLKNKCDSTGEKLDSVQYRARYAVDPAFRESERKRTSGTRWTNRADGRDDGTLDRATVRSLFAAAKSCAYCLSPMKSGDKSLDHMTPLSLGGWHSVHNVLVCCRRCNSAKHNKPWDEWVESLSPFVRAGLVLPAGFVERQRRAA
jgi:hypothetical protein